MDFVVSNKIKGVENKEAFLLSIGYTTPTNLYKIENGSQSFRIEHLINCCKVYGVDANYLLVKSHIQMIVNSSKVSAIANLEMAVRNVKEYVKSIK